MTAIAICSHNDKPLMIPCGKCWTYALRRLLLAEKVVKASRKRMEVWTRETYLELEDALSRWDDQEKKG